MTFFSLHPHRRTRRLPSLAGLVTAGALIVGAASPGSVGDVPGDDSDRPDVGGPARGTVQRVSVTNDGAEARFKSTIAAATQVSSARGTFVVFSTQAPLVPLDTNETDDVYLRDLAGRTTVLVSTTADGMLGNDFSVDPSMSANGRYVAFTTWASNLFPDDRNGHVLDVVVKDLATGEVTVVSRRPGGGQSRKSSLMPVISGNGRYVAFQTYGVFSRHDDDRREDVYLHDLDTGRNELVSVDRKGQPLQRSVLVGGISHNGRYVTFGHDNSAWVRDMRERSSTRFWNEPDVSDAFPAGTVGRPAISGDGRFVAFSTRSRFVVPGDAGRRSDVFRLDLESGRFEQVTLGFDGSRPDHESFAPTLSYSGRFVAFVSYASNLVSRDTNRYHDAFRRDMRIDRTVLVSAGPDGPANERSGRSNTVSIAPDGQHVVFTSYATNLGADDTNGVQDVYRWQAPGVSRP